MGTPRTLQAPGAVSWRTQPKADTCVSPLYHDRLSPPALLLGSCSKVRRGQLSTIMLGKDARCLFISPAAMHFGRASRRLGDRAAGTPLVADATTAKAAKPRGR